MKCNVYRRNNRRSSWLAIALLLAFVSMRTRAQERQLESRLNTARIFVDPDVRVSHDGDVVHMETYVSASATSSNLLLAGGELIFPDRQLNASQAQIYRSVDAGARWSPVLLPDESTGGWDNAIVGGFDGSAYFLTSNFEKGLTVYRTTDGGVTWASTVLANAAGWDRPHVTVDTTKSSFRGTFYVAGEANDGVRLMSSADGGRTFSSSTAACPHPKDWNAATSASLLVLSDGTLVVPCLPYPNEPVRSTWTEAEFGTVSSRDGGQTFSPYHKGLIAHRALDRQMFTARTRGIVMLSGNFMQGPSFAVAPPMSRFSDRIFAIWQDITSTGESRLLTAWSKDRGETWSAPVPVTSSTDRNGSSSQQGVPMVAVSRDGVLGIAWFDSWHARNGKGYDVYFTASMDGGNTFLQPVRVSTATSEPASELNIVPALNAVKAESGAKLLIQMTSPFSDRATGGDYSSMAVDAAGRFHPLWADARGGTWQIYTATIRVLSDDALNKLLTQIACPVDIGQIQLLFDEPTWNTAKNDLTVPVRILNNSANSIVNSLSVRITPAWSGQQWMKLVPDPSSLAPIFLDNSRANSENEGTFVYRSSPTAPLFPNSVSVPLQWYLHVPNPNFVNFSFEAEIANEKCPDLSNLK